MTNSKIYNNFETQNKAKQIKNGRSPTCLGVVIEQMHRDGDIKPLDSFLQKSPESWGKWIVDSFVRKPVVWSFTKIKSTVITSNSNISYAHLNAIEAASQKLLDNFPASMKNKIIELKSLAEYLHFNNEEQLNILIHCLHCKGKLSVKTLQNRGETITLLKFHDISSIKEIIDKDVDIYTLRKSEETLQKDIEKLEKQVIQLISDAKGYLSKSQKHSVNFVISQFVALALASLFRTVLHPSKTKSEIRHGFGLVFGLIIGYFCFGIQALHLAGLPSLCYIVIRTTSPQIMQRIVLAVALIYLSCIHLHRQMYDYASYTLDISGPLMIITQKVTSLAFCIHDGIARAESELSKTQKAYAVKNIPSALEYFSYSLQFPSLMAGPALFYKDYIDFIDGKNFLPTAPPSGSSRDSSTRIVIHEPSPVTVVCKKVIASMTCVVIFVKFLPMFPINRVKDSDFVENTSLLYKFWYLNIATMLIRFKYYFAWLFADAVCNNSGIGFNGYDANEVPKWDKFTNVYLFQFEFGTSLRECIEAWNIGTNTWLRRVVYERVDKYPTVLTYALSALWHGFYPGYYITFANGALFTFAARSMRRRIRDYFTGNSEMKMMYDVATFITTRLVMSYITFTFVLLEFWPGIRLYLHMYLCLHVLALVALFVVPRVIPKANPGTTTQLTANGSIANVLRSASRPITNSVSNHHD